MKRNHWFGCGVSSGVEPSLGNGTPEKPQRSDNEHRLVGSSGFDVVLLGHMNRIEVMFCIPPVQRMQGTNLAPMLMRSCGDGPIMGLNRGLIMIGDLVRTAFSRRAGISMEFGVDRRQARAWHPPFLMSSPTKTATWMAVMV